MKKFKKYIWNILVSIDQFFNVLIFLGDPDETISSNAGKKNGKVLRATILSWILNKIDPNHVNKYRESDEGKDAVIK